MAHKALRFSLFISFSSSDVVSIPHKLATTSVPVAEKFYQHAVVEVCLESAP